VQNPIALREATAEDLSFLARLYRDTRQDVEGWGWPQEQQEWFLRMQFDARQRSYAAAFPHAKDRIVYVEDTPAGRILVDHEPAGLHLIDIALLREFRNRGVGGELIGGLQKECAQEGWTLRLQVAADNPAIRLYRQLGFAETGADALYMQMIWTLAESEGTSMAGHLTADDFAPHVDSRFQVTGESNFELVLTSVKDTSNAQLEQFSLAFVGQASPWLPQGQYKLTHAHMGECELFLVPNGPDAGGMRYEAAFSRFIKEANAT
jgi:ribosomal protein S18 acetylase RimI-like enzyme